MAICATFSVICILNAEGIIGGLDARAGQFPYSVSFREYRIDEHFCGGAIISDRYILTVGHCMQQYRSNVENIYAIVGALLRKNEGTLVKLASISTHPQFNWTLLKNDIAMVRTAGKIEFSGTIKPIALPDTEFRKLGAVPVMLSGFGRLSVSVKSQVFSEFYHQE